MSFSFTEKKRTEKTECLGKIVVWQALYSLSANIWWTRCVQRLLKSMPCHCTRISSEVSADYNPISGSKRTHTTSPKHIYRPRVPCINNRPPHFLLGPRLPYPTLQNWALVNLQARCLSAIEQFGSCQNSFSSTSSSFKFVSRHFQSKRRRFSSMLSQLTE